MTEHNRTLPDKVKRTGWILLTLGVIIIALSFALNKERALYDYLWMYMFLVSIGVGSLALVSLEYLVGATWSTPFRRISEFLAALVPALIILVIPLVISVPDIFTWANKDVVNNDAILRAKEAYLNFNFFLIRVIICLFIWTIFYVFFIRNSEKQDVTRDPLLTRNNIRLSVIFTPLFIITLSITAIDWMMSLEPHWYSTIFGVYYFAGTVVAAFSATTLIAVLLKERNYLNSRITNDHLYSLGTLMFGFNIFWAYIGFSQFLLIWYADLPEETFWLINRWEGDWKYISLALLFVHFIIPFLVLLPRRAKVNPKLLKFMAVWMLCAHALDLYWLIMPVFGKTGPFFSWMELGFPLAIVGISMLIFKMKSDKRNLTPVGDPKLEAGLNFKLY